LYFHIYVYSKEEWSYNLNKSNEEKQGEKT